MLGKVKQMLGIEGVDVNLELPEYIDSESDVLKGKIILKSKSKQQINSILIRFIERFSRGKKNEKRIDEYVVGKLFLDEPLSIDVDEVIIREFELPYKIVKSEMDKIQDRNIFYKGVVKLAKLINKVKSEYRVEAEIDVKGTRLNPINKTVIEVQ